MGITSSINDLVGQTLGSTSNNKVGIGGFTSTIRKKEVVEYKSDAPDNYVENGSYINDHIIVNPIMITIEGEVANVHITQKALNRYVSEPVDRIGNLITNVFPSSKTQYTVNKIKTVISDVTEAFDKVDNYVKNAKDLFNMIGGNIDSATSESLTLQETFVKFLETVNQKKLPITIEMPNATYDDMVIGYLSIVRDNLTNQAISYKLSAKQLRFAKTETTSVNKYFKNAFSSVKNKIKSKINKGIQQGIKKSFLYSLFN